MSPSSVQARKGGDGRGDLPPPRDPEDTLALLAGDVQRDQRLPPLLALHREAAGIRLIDRNHLEFCLKHHLKLPKLMLSSDMGSGDQVFQAKIRTTHFC